jgi:hypothetical protein
MSSVANRGTAYRKYLRGLPAYTFPELLITEVFSEWPEV